MLSIYRVESSVTSRAQEPFATYEALLRATMVKSTESGSRSMKVLHTFVASRRNVSAGQKGVQERKVFIALRVGGREM